LLQMAIARRDASAKLAAEQGIRVNAVAPGPVWTSLIPSTMALEKVKTFGENAVFKRPAQPIDWPVCSSSWLPTTRAMCPARSTAQPGPHAVLDCLANPLQIPEARRSWIRWSLRPDTTSRFPRGCCEQAASACSQFGRAV
jgi:NAD(P)-dependent dehydrogenase (short-subunit alcohol dehydrogenase family)